MYGDFILFESDERQIVRSQRLPLGDTLGRNEAWLRDTLLKHSEILPIGELDPSLGPLVSAVRRNTWTGLCRDSKARPVFNGTK